MAMAKGIDQVMGVQCAGSRVGKADWFRDWFTIMTHLGIFPRPRQVRSGG